MSETSPKPHKTLYQRVTASVPLMVTIAVHVVLILVAAALVVSEQLTHKKKEFEAPPPSDNSAVQKQVEHRLQVARKAGGSSSSSPVSASRIFSTSQDALQLPSMPDLPSSGASAMAGMGFGAGLGAMGTGTGFNTGGVGSGMVGKGFMSMSFLGVTNQRASKVVFIVDIGKSMMDVRKGGFEAFKIIREEMMKLISKLPPSAEFNVILYEQYSWRNSSVVAFDSKLLPATAGNKQEFFDWFSKVNTLDSMGLGSAVGHRVNWTPKPLTGAGIDEDLRPPEWALGLHFALEQQPDTLFIVAGGPGDIRKAISDAEMAKRKRDYEKVVADLKRDGLDADVINAARNRSMSKARAELDAINVKQRAAGKPPFVIVNNKRIADADFQAALKRAGYSITIDKTGWTNKQGQLIWYIGVDTAAYGDFNDLMMHISKLKRTLLKDQISINFFLFVGPNEKPEATIENLSNLTRRNSGKFELITTKRLEEISRRDAEKK